LAELGSEHALVVHNRDGLDEIGLASLTDAFEVKGGAKRALVFDAASFGVESAPLESLFVEDVSTARECVEQVLEGRPGPRADVVVVNAAAALLVAERAATLRDGVAQARAAIASGAARAVLDRLIDFTRAAAKAGDASAPRARL